jgi:methylmalonyl-CoA mutase
MDDAPLALTADFPVPSIEDWRVLVEKTLGLETTGEGDPLASIRSRIDDDYPIDPLYYPDNSAPPLTLRRATPTDPDRPWDTRSLIYDPDPAHANELALSELNGGASSLTVGFHLGASWGFLITKRDELARVLDGVLLDVAPVALDADELGAEAAQWLGDLAKGAPAAPLAFNLDPLGVFASDGRSSAPMTTIIDRDAHVAGELAQAYPKASLFLASGAPIHESGGSIGQELGFALACALAYAKALAATGMPLHQAFSGVTLCLVADADYFTTLAKVRAGRALMARLAAACGVDIAPRVEARSSRRMLSAVDPWTNLLRLASACAGAAMGGADIVQLDPFTFQASYMNGGRASDLARRQARNIQLVLMEESRLGGVADPAAGSWFLESLSDTLARFGWVYFQWIEGQGGALAALKGGELHKRVSVVLKERWRALGAREACIVGVTDFIDLDGAKAEIPPWDREVGRKAPPKPKLRGERDDCTCFVPCSLAEAFEGDRRRRSLRRTDHPKIYLATLGDRAGFGPRTAFAKTLIAIGGYKGEVGDAGAYDPALSPVAILCGSEAAYAESAVSAAAALKAAGARRVLLAGKPDAREGELRSAGVDDFIYAGCDVFGPLRQLMLEIDFGPAAATFPWR